VQILSFGRFRNTALSQICHFCVVLNDSKRFYAKHGSNTISSSRNRQKPFIALLCCHEMQHTLRPLQNLQFRHSGLSGNLKFTDSAKTYS